MPTGHVATRLMSNRPSRSAITMLPTRGVPRNQRRPWGPAGVTRSVSPGSSVGAMERSATTARQMRRAVITMICLRPVLLRYALEAAKDFANASVAATSSAAAAGSTFCLFFEASFSSFQT